MALPCRSFGHGWTRPPRRNRGFAPSTFVPVPARCPRVFLARFVLFVQLGALYWWLGRMAAVEAPARPLTGFESLWDLVDVIQCITLRTRPERKREAAAQFARVGLSDRVHFLVQEPDAQDGKRGCFHAHQQAARRALELGARRALTFEDDVEFTADFTPFAATRAAKFAGSAEPWEIFFLGHFPRKMELTAQRDVVKVRSMDGHAYLLSPEGMRRLCGLEYRGDQVRPVRSSPFGLVFVGS